MEEPLLYILRFPLTLSLSHQVLKCTLSTDCLVPIANEHSPFVNSGFLLPSLAGTFLS
jgi:hypothetical protein